MVCCGYCEQIRITLTNQANVSVVTPAGSGWDEASGRSAILYEPVISELR